MRHPVALVTGANGEIGHALVKSLSAGDEASGRPPMDVVALDLAPLTPELEELVLDSEQGDILDTVLLERLVSRYDIRAIYHLAALLSTRSEHAPEAAHRVNVEGTLNLLRLAADQATRYGHEVVFLFPSSIAVYGLPDKATKAEAGPIKERSWNLPRTMYGCNKLYCEHVGRYYADHFRQLDARRVPTGVDFRALRFPGLISADTTPTGGTSDYGPEMLHAAASGQAYDCFVEPGATIPFMVMPDAVDAILDLAWAPVEALSQRVYNVSAFSLSAEEIRQHVLAAFPEAQIGFSVDPARDAIVASWPAEVLDQPARDDWGWQPRYGAEAAFRDYLVPRISARYASPGDEA
jgi:nucleoside-diphosphate-sugar epimerase